MSILKYDPLSGVFTYTITTRNGKGKQGEPAGHCDSKGYIHLWVDGKQTFAHRYAWFLTYGEYPKGQIDHIDGNPSNNTITNLRDVTPVVNAQNQIKPMNTNRTGYLGVYYDKDKDRFRAEIIVKGIRHRLGWYRTAEEAAAAYIGAKSVLHPESFVAMNNPTDKDASSYGEGSVTFKSLPDWLRP